MKNSRSKKGNLFFEGLTILFILVIVAIFAFYGSSMLSDINTDIQADDSYSIQAKNVTQIATTNYPKIWDASILFLVIGLWIVTIIGAFQIETHPVFFFITIALFIFGIFAGGIFQDLFLDVASDMPVEASSFPMTMYLFNHTYVLILMIMVTVGIALYTRFSQ